MKASASCRVVKSLAAETQGFGGWQSQGRPLLCAVVHEGEQPLFAGNVVNQPKGVLINS
jgi:hypothetical protein